MSNQVIISGSLVRDPELKFTNNGNAVTNFTVRVITGQKRDGDEYAPSAFVDVACWNTSSGGKLAENVAESFRDKDRVVVVGKLIQDEWEDKETGAKRTKIKVLAFEVAADTSYATVSVKSNERSGGGGGQRQASRPAPSQTDEPPW
jgi:single-strand DNA-binding protein